MSFGDPILRGAALLLLLGSCARPTEVELRLFPCGLTNMTPVTVDLDVQGYDAAGTALAPLHASFAVAMGDLGDGYATVGLRPPAQIATADFTLTWRDAMGGAQVVTHAALDVPAVGEVLELGADMCVPLGSTASSGTSTGEGTSTGTGTSTGSSSSSSSTGGGTSTSSSSSSTGEGTSTSTSTGETTETSTTGESSMVGSGCVIPDEQYYCEHGGPGQVGTLLECVRSLWTKANLKERCDDNSYCEGLGLVEPVGVGCSGEGAIGWICVCQDKVPVPCLFEEAGCDVSKLLLCIDDGQGTEIRTRGACVEFCSEADPAGPQCSSDPP